MYNPRYVDFARHYGFEIAPCNVGAGHEKGRVEAGVGYVKKNLLAGLEIADFSHLKQGTAECGSSSASGEYRAGQADSQVGRKSGSDLRVAATRMATRRPHSMLSARWVCIATRRRLCPPGRGSPNTSSASAMTQVSMCSSAIAAIAPRRLFEFGTEGVRSTATPDRRGSGKLPQRLRLPGLGSARASTSAIDSESHARRCSTLRNVPNSSSCKTLRYA